MYQLSLPRLFKLVYPYFVISRVITLLLGSLIFLILHESIHRFRLSKLSDSRVDKGLSYVNRVG